jgi:hypothetical protein
VFLGQQRYDFIGVNAIGTAYIDDVVLFTLGNPPINLCKVNEQLHLGKA